MESPVMDYYRTLTALQLPDEAIKKENVWGKEPKELFYFEKSTDVWNDTSALRELWQNALDHLQAWKNGVMQEFIHMDFNVEKSPIGTCGQLETTRITFFFVHNAKRHDLLKVILEDKKTSDNAKTFILTVKQYYTSILPGISLGCNVSENKEEEKCSTGGFGMGLKDMLAVFIAHRYNVTYTMRNDECGVQWNFSRERHGERYKIGFTKKAGKSVKTIKDFINMDSDENKHTLTITITGDNHFCDEGHLRQSFRDSFFKSLCRCTAFFSSIKTSDTFRIITNKDTKDILIDSNYLRMHEKLQHLKPEFGIYVKGMWVEPFELPKASLFLATGNVNSKDRNTIGEKEVTRALKSIVTFVNAGQHKDAFSWFRYEKGMRFDDDKSWLREKYEYPWSEIWTRVFANNKQEFYKILGIQNAILVDDKYCKGSNYTLDWAIGHLRHSKKKIVYLSCNALHSLFKRYKDGEIINCAIDLLDKSCGNDTKSYQNVVLQFAEELERIEKKSNMSSSDTSVLLFGYKILQSTKVLLLPGSRGDTCVYEEKRNNLIMQRKSLDKTPFDTIDRMIVALVRNFKEFNNYSALAFMQNIQRNRKQIVQKASIEEGDDFYIEPTPEPSRSYSSGATSSTDLPSANQGRTASAGPSYEFSFCGTSTHVETQTEKEWNICVKCKRNMQQVDMEDDGNSRKRQRLESLNTTEQSSSSDSE